MRYTPLAGAKQVNLDMGDEATEHSLFMALYSYIQGTPVVVFAPNKAIIHGTETLESIVATNEGRNAFTVYGIDPDRFFATDWADIMESARRIWVNGEKFGDGFVQFVRDGIALTENREGYDGRHGMTSKLG